MLEPGGWSEEGGIGLEGVGADKQKKIPTAVCFLICSRQILCVFDGQPNLHEWLN